MWVESCRAGSDRGAGGNGQVRPRRDPLYHIDPYHHTDGWRRAELGQTRRAPPAVGEPSWQAHYEIRRARGFARGHAAQDAPPPHLRQNAGRSMTAGPLAQQGGGQPHVFRCALQPAIRGGGPVNIAIHSIDGFRGRRLFRSQPHRVRDQAPGQSMGFGSPCYGLAP